MSCQVCLAAPGVVALKVPAEHGVELMKMCADCASNSGVFCIKHQSQHMIFADNTSACPFCVHEGLQELGKKTTNFHTLLAFNLDDRQWQQLVDHIPYYPGTPGFEQSVGKMLVTAEYRYKRPRQEVVLCLASNKDPGYIILPPILVVPAVPAA